MGSGPVVVRLLAEQRKRCLATILTAAESADWWHGLTHAQQATFREQVRGAVAVFYDLCRDVVKVTEDDGGAGMRNDLALELIRALHGRQPTQPPQQIDGQERRPDRKPA